MLRSVQEQKQQYANPHARVVRVCALRVCCVVRVRVHMTTHAPTHAHITRQKQK